jgi:propanediol dehydratase large subunit
MENKQETKGLESPEVKMISVEEMIDFLVNNRDLQISTYGKVLDEEEIKSLKERGLKSEDVAMIMRGMGLSPATTEILKSF